MNVSDVMTGRVVTCRPEDSDDWAAQLLWENDCGVLPVVDGDGRAVGMLSDRDLCMAAFTTGRPLSRLPVADAMSNEVVGCRPDDSLEVALEGMRRRRVRRLPVVDDGRRVVGLLAINDVLRALERPGAPRAGLAEATLRTLRAIGTPHGVSEEADAGRTTADAAWSRPLPRGTPLPPGRSSPVRVRDLMTRKVATALPTDTLAQAVQRMKDRECGCVTVVDGTGKVVGILTDRDVCLAALPADRPLSRMKVGDLLRPQVHTCTPEETVADAEERMGRHQIRRLPVVDARGRLQGILSLDDIAREAWREEDLIVAPVSAEGVGRTLGQVSRPHVIESG